MINFLSPSRVVDPGVDYFYIGDFTGPAHNKVKLWWRSCPAPTVSTAEYDFVPAQDDYIAFLHTNDTKPTLLEYESPSHYNMNKATDCLSATLYGAAAWGDDVTKVLVVNADRNETGLHLADINYHGTAEFVLAWTALTGDPVTFVTPSDIRIDTSDHCSLLMTNDYYVSEVSVDDVLATTVVHNALKRVYSLDAEHITSTAGMVSTGIEFATVLYCNYESDTVGALVIQYATDAGGPWTDYSPLDVVWTQPTMSLIGTIPYAQLPIATYVYLRAKVSYGAKTFYGSKWQYRTWGYPPLFPKRGDYIVINGTRQDVGPVKFKTSDGSVVLVKEVLRSYTNKNVSQNEPDPTSYTARIAERDWADFWASPTVIVSSIEMGPFDANNAYANFVSAVFADSTVGVVFYYYGILTLYRLSGGVWNEVTLPSVPSGYTLDSDQSLLLVDLDHPCLVTTIVQNNPWGTGLIIYDITLNTWTVQGGSVDSGYSVAFNTAYDRLFFISAVDGLWHCTSLALPSNAIWFVNSI